MPNLLEKTSEYFHKKTDKIQNEKKEKRILSYFQTYQNFSTKKQTFFAKKLSFLIRSGVPILESIYIIKDQAKSKSEIHVYEKIINDVANGQTLANSLAKFKNVFGKFTINVIKSGESSGTLFDNLNYLADELNKKELLRKKIIGALVYPIIVTVATFGITGFLTVYIFPKIVPLFQSLNADLPITTRLVIYLTNSVLEHGVIIFSILAFIIIGIIISIKKIKAIRFFYDGLILRIPIFGSIILNYNLTNTTRTLGLLLKSGISINEALSVTSDTTENMRYKQAFLEISSGILKGKNLSGLINNYPIIFPAMLTHMIAIGEKSGNLSNTLIYLAEYYEHEFDDQTKNLSSTIEPVLMIIMGLMVGFIAISVITPIYGITNNIQK